MTKSLFISTVDRNTTAVNVTEYSNIFGRTNYSDSNENFREHTIRDDGVFSNLRLNVITEGFSANATWRTRINNADGAQSIVYQVTGVLEDTVNTDTVAAGDEMNYQHVPPATGQMVYSFCQMIFTPTTTTDCVTGMSGTNASTAAASTTNYHNLNSQTSFSVTTESQANTEQRKTGVFRNFQINISSNARTTTTTIRTRLAAANGGQSIAFTTQTGIIEDTVGSDSVIAGNDFNFQSVTGTGTQSVSLFMAVFFVSTAGIQQYISGRTAGFIIDGDDVTSYLSIQGGIGDSETTTEAQASAKVPEATVFSELTINVTGNTMDGAETNVFTFMDDTVATTIVVNNTSTQTGIISDSVNTASVAADSLVDIQLNPAGAANDDLTLRAVSIWATTTAAAAAVEEVLTRAFSLTPGQMDYVRVGLGEGGFQPVGLKPVFG